MIKLLKDQSGLSLIELLIAVVLVTIVVSGFASAAVGAGSAVTRNADRSTVREERVGKVDEKTHNQFAVKDSEGNELYSGQPTKSISLKIGGNTTSIDCYQFAEKGENYNYAVYVRK